MKRKTTEESEIDPDNLVRYIDDRSPVTEFLPKFTIDPDTQATLHAMVEAGYEINCNNICHPAFWDNDWLECPLCGGHYDKDVGLFIHQGEQ